METNKISVVINTYNAEQHLKECLEAVKNFDEIVVCDMESTDHTGEIAKSYGCKIVTFPKADHKSAEPARTFAIQSATNKWVFVVDADEIVTSELRDALYKEIGKADCPAGFYIPRQNMFLGKFVGGRHSDYQLRFFIREGTEWPPYVHTFPKVQGQVVKLKSVKEARLVHLMDETMHQYLEKINLYTDNEVEKKCSKNYNGWSLVWRPFWRFFKKYILEGGILEGKRGYMRAQLAAIYQFVMVSKIIEGKQREELKK